MRLIIRDDDINYFTRADQLARLYEPLLAAGGRVCLSIIPEQEVGLSPHPRHVPPYAISARFRDKHSRVPISGNEALCTFLDRYRDWFQFAQHGCRHTFHEFASDEPSHIHSLLTAGRTILVEAGLWSDVGAHFVAPFDYLSSCAGQVVRSHAYSISATQAVLDMHGWRPYLEPHSSTAGESGPSESPASRPFYAVSMFADEALARAHEHIPDPPLTHVSPLVIANHYWYYFDSAGRPIHSKIRRFQEFIRSLITRYDACLCSFVDLERAEQCL